MLDRAYPLLKNVLFRLEPEQAHRRTIQALSAGLHPRFDNARFPALRQTLFGLNLPNPVAVAAGFDKDAEVPDALLALGCGFAEVGTVTPLAQQGNPRPRVFRLVSDRAMINRLGFNNHGHEAALARLQARRGRGGVVGVNIGANKHSTDRIDDYCRGIRRFVDVADFFVVNISSPNTPGLRDLQAAGEIDALLEQVMTTRRQLFEVDGKPRRPILVKLAPDIADEDLPGILDVMMQRGVDGISVSNTTLRRDGLKDQGVGAQAGGLSGAPVFDLSTRMLARVYQFTGGQVPLIGIGGIDRPERALEKIEAGASLVQLYTGLVYEGPRLIERMLVRLDQEVRAAGVKDLTELVGRTSEEWAVRPLSA